MTQLLLLCHMSNDVDCLVTEHTQIYVLSRQTMLLSINLHYLVDIGLEPFLRNI